MSRRSQRHVRGSPPQINRAKEHGDLATLRRLTTLEQEAQEPAKEIEELTGETVPEIG